LKRVLALKLFALRFVVCCCSHIRLYKMFTIYSDGVLTGEKEMCHLTNWAIQIPGVSKEKEKTPEQKENSK